MTASYGGGNASKFNTFACASAIVASLINMIFGYDTGVMSGAMLFIQEDLKINDTQVEVLAGILNLCALVGSLLAGRAADYIGRRYTIVLSSIIFMMGSILMGYGPNYVVLLTGRCIAGIGVGFALLIAPIYAAEISAPSSRGLLTCFPELCTNVGILLGYLANYAFANLALKLGWRMMLGFAAIPSLFIAFGILKMPESPRWLVLQGRLTEAKKALLLVSNTEEEAEQRFRDIKLAVGIIDENENIGKKETARGGEGVWKELLFKSTPAVRWILLAGIGIHFFQHAVGIEAVVLYSPRIFRKAGITSKNKLLLATVGVGLTKTMFVLLSTVTLDRFGRRKLLMTSIGGMLIAVTTLGFSLTMAHYKQVELLWAVILSFVSVYAYVAFFSVGLGPVTWVYTSEIFPLRLRAQGVAICVAVNRAMNATISMSFISIYKAITIGGAFFMFGGISLVALFFYYFFLPETKGRTLEEMELLFSKNSQSTNIPQVELQTTSSIA